jgi:hypothetical protein
MVAFSPSVAIKVMDRPSSATVKRLFALSHNCCAFPGCDRPLIEPLSQEVVGQICHIKAASEGGPRFDSRQTSEERHDFANLILMCRDHHVVIDRDIEGYPPSRLTAIKQEHESKSTEPDATGLSEQTIQKLIATISSSHSITQSKFSVSAKTIQGVAQGDGQTVHMNFGDIK